MTLACQGRFWWHSGFRPSPREPERGIPREEQLVKFYQLAAEVLPKAKIDKIVLQIDRMDELEDVSQLL